MTFEESYFGKIRALVGSRMLKVPGFRIIMENDEGRILLQLRGDWHKWGLPAGLPEENENISETIQREVLEETGLRVTEFTPWGFASSVETDVFIYPNGDIIHNYSLGIYTNKWEGELSVDGEETLSLGFFDPYNLPEMIVNHRLTIEKYLEYKSTGKFKLF
jgi:8-oxo-dGTP pyrophosphatase MutT (NUDIX family)